MQQPCGYAWDLSGAKFVIELGTTRYLYKGGKRLTFTRTELDILGFLISNANKEMDAGAISKKVDAYESSVATHVSNIRGKDSNLRTFIPTGTRKKYIFKCLDLTPVYDTDALDKAIKGDLTYEGFPQSDDPVADRPKELDVSTLIVAGEPSVRPLAVDIVGYVILTVGLVCVVGAFVTSVFVRATFWMDYVLTIAVSMAYGLLCAIDLALEGAYEFDTYSWSRLKKVYVALFLVNSCALLTAVNMVSLLQKREYGYSLLVAVSILIAGNLVSCLAVFFVLPNRPITIARFQTQSAIGAFCKNIIIYNLPLYSIFVLLPWALIQAGGELSRSLPIAAALLVIFLLVAVGSVIGTSYLSDRLVSSKRGQSYPYHGLFSTFLLVRTILMFLAPFIFVILYISRASGSR